jgi:ATP-dependent RNA helicase RhlE
MLFPELNISKPLLRALEDLNFKNPTAIQSKAFPVVMSGQDVIGIAQTGTGKTFAYLLPVLRQLAYSEQKAPRVLIVVPTRELVVQVVEEIKKLTKYMNGVRIAGIFGGANIRYQRLAVLAGIDILVATPGRLMDLYSDGTLPLRSIQKFVIDEVDEMLNLGFRAQLLTIMNALPPRRQNILFSATLDEDVEKMIAEHFIKPQYVELVSRGTPLEKIVQLGYRAPNFTTKINLLEHLLVNDESLKKVLVFVKNKKLADRLFEKLEERLPELSGVIHSNKSQGHRFSVLDKFAKGEHRVLIATDIISRGLDIAEVSHVINFDTPVEPGEYIHRIGRTGRADKAGTSITFIADGEKVYQEEIEKLMNKKITMLKVPAEVEISDYLYADEKPIVRDKNLLKLQPKVKPTGAYHEKKAKNKKIQLGGARKQESKRRLKLKRMGKKRGGK